MIKDFCPLCKSENTISFSKDKKREYKQCNSCFTIFVPQKYHLSIEDEKKRYDLHTNSPNDKYYIEFLSRIIDPIQKQLKSGARGLDFGCGPGPILKKLFSIHKIEIEEYDLYYNDNKDLLSNSWDFIVTTEVMEHLKDPLSIIEKLWALINKEGLLAIMTSIFTEDLNFASWYYKGDPTHITFFTKDSFLWLSEKLDCKIEFFDKDIIIFKKN